MARVSVIVPVYNTGKYVEKCLNSLTNQTIKDELEIINRRNSLKYKRHEIDKIELKRYYDGITTIEFKKNENKHSISFKDTPYLIKIYDLSLVKLFG